MDHLTIESLALNKSTFTRLLPRKSFNEWLCQESLKSYMEGPCSVSRLTVKYVRNLCLPHRTVVKISVGVMTKHCVQ